MTFAPRLAPAKSNLAPLVVLLGLVSAQVACGDKPPPPKAPTSTTTEAPTAAAPKRELPPETPTAEGPSSVRISDEIVRLCGIKANDAYFAFDSAALRKDDIHVLDQVATCFATGPLKGRTLRVVGHTDPRGPAEYNITLGQSRADAVAGYVSGKGLDKAKVQSSSRGAMDAEGTNEAGWAKDRRVDLVLAP